MHLPLRFFRFGMETQRQNLKTKNSNFLMSGVVFYKTWEG
jgi:hypothetical protein